MLPFYQTSLTQGEDAAFLKELLESLWVKCNDIVLLRSTSSARYFAGFPTGYTALLGGLTENGRSAVNVLSFLCLDAYQSVQLPQPNLGVRTNALIDTPFLMKTAETIRLGTGIPQIFNDEVVVSKVRPPARFSKPVARCEASSSRVCDKLKMLLAEARTWNNCGEVSRISSTEPETNSNSSEISAKRARAS